MGIQEDRNEFNNTGIRGLLRRVMQESDEAFIKELAGGWRGEVVAHHPIKGSGPYLHFRRGYPVIRYSNASPDDQSCMEYRIEI